MKKNKILFTILSMFVLLFSFVFSEVEAATRNYKSFDFSCKETYDSKNSQVSCKKGKNTTYSGSAKFTAKDKGSAVFYGKYNSFSTQGNSSAKCTINGKNGYCTITETVRNKWTGKEKKTNKTYKLSSSRYYDMYVYMFPNLK